jgi:hypothetical protein
MAVFLNLFFTRGTLTHLTNILAATPAYLLEKKHNAQEFETPLELFWTLKGAVTPRFRTTDLWIKNSLYMTGLDLKTTCP